MDGVRTLSFYQEWNETHDSLCDGMTVLEPGALIFAGFYKFKCE